MINSTTHNLRLPIYGQANQPQVATQQGGPFCQDPVMEGRKGRLYLLATPDTDRDLLKRFALHYYGNTSYDIIPTLQSAMAFAHSDHGLTGQIHVAVVVHDLSLHVVATDEGDVYQYRSGTVSHPLDEHSFRAELPIPGAHASREPAGALRVRSIKVRLTLGDSVVLGLRRMPSVVGRVLPRILRQSQDPTAVAARLSRVARGKVKEEVPFAVIMMPGLSPISGVGLTGSRRPPTSPSAPGQPLPAARPRGERSPIWIALLVAALAVAFSLWLTKPKIDTDALAEMFMQMLTPVASETPVGAEEPSPEVTPLAPAVEQGDAGS